MVLWGQKRAPWVAAGAVRGPWLPRRRAVLLLVPQIGSIYPLSLEELALDPARHGAFLRKGRRIQVRSRATPPLRLGARVAPTTRGGRPRTLVELRKSCGDGRHLLGEGVGGRPNPSA